MQFMVRKGNILESISDKKENFIEATSEKMEIFQSHIHKKGNFP